LYPPGSYYLDGFDWGAEQHPHDTYGDAACGGPSVYETHLHYMMDKKKVISGNFCFVLFCFVVNQ
jgi:hypothetical protein